MISLVAIASTIDDGTMCVMKLVRLNAFSSSPTEAAGGGSLKPKPVPGATRSITASIPWNNSNPSASETSDAVTNHAIVRPPTRPSAVMSPICAIPTTSVENTSGAMIILISRRKIVVTIEKPAPISFSRAVAAGVPSAIWWLIAHPTINPSTSPIRI
jgi:hypothetical protein